MLGQVVSIVLGTNHVGWERRGTHSFRFLLAPSLAQKKLLFGLVCVSADDTQF